MVTVTNFKIVETDKGETYVRLQLEGDLEMIKSDKTGNFYAHTKKCSISSTFDEVTAQNMIGKQLTGSIIKEEVEPYEYEIDGEILTLSHRWAYSDQSPQELAVQDLVKSVSSNGQTQLEAA